MTDEVFNKAIERFQRIVEVVGKLPPDLQASAFNALAPLIQLAPSSAPPLAPPAAPGVAAAGNKTSKKEVQEAPEDREAFFGSFNHEKPHDNVRLLIAWLYSQYGTESFSLNELRDLANDVGLTVPERLDMTVKSAREDGKTLFTSTGRGKFKPTVHGEAFLKAEYGVKKGTGKRPAVAE